MDLTQPSLKDSAESPNCLKRYIALEKPAQDYASKWVLLDNFYKKNLINKKIEKKKKKLMKY